MNQTRLHQLVERVSSLFRSSLRQAATAHGLKLVQLEALVYLATANGYSDTAAGLSEYLGLTKGTVSQTIKVLERRDLIEKVQDPKDGRIVHCRLTKAGREIVAMSYPAAGLGVLPVGQGDVEGALESLLRAMQQANGSRTFGICGSCVHFQALSHGGRCGLTREELSAPEAGMICREHEPRALVGVQSCF